jgi:hypothetical protein
MSKMLSPKLRESHDDRGSRWLAIWCPGCEWEHMIPVEKPNPANGALWSFDGNAAAPTFAPSLHLVGTCHSIVRAGRIQFLPDCSHKLAGQTVDLPDWPPEAIER